MLTFIQKKENYKRKMNIKDILILLFFSVYPITPNEINNITHILSGVPVEMRGWG
jgi:hypothetical protein